MSVYHCPPGAVAVVVHRKSSLSPAGSENATFAAAELIIPLPKGYTFSAFADVLNTVIRYPASAVGRATPFAPEITVETTLKSVMSAVAVPCVEPAAEIPVATLCTTCEVDMILAAVNVPAAVRVANVVLAFNVVEDCQLKPPAPPPCWLIKLVSPVLPD